MLHIIGMIFKIIGIILAVILGILVLLICIVLFVPLRYQADASFKGTLDSLTLHMKLSWLLHMFSVRVSYEQGELKWRARLFYFKKMDSDTEEKEEKPAMPVQSKEPVTVKKKREIAPAEITAQEIKEEIKEESRKLQRAETVSEKKVEAVTKTAEDESTEQEDNKFTGKLKLLWEKVKSFFENIKYTIQKICDKIRVLAEKKEEVSAFIEDESHRKAFSRTKKEVVRLLRFLKPKKFFLNTRFGFEDPYRTGQVLAALSIIYPFVGGHMSVDPDFENKVLEADLAIKGKVRVIYAVIAAWNMFWDKNVRLLYKEIKQMSGKK